MSSNKEKAEKYLKANNVEAVHVTSDGFMFTRNHLAKQHGKTLEDKEVETFKAAKQKAETTEGTEPQKPKRFLDNTVDDISAVLPEMDDLGMLEAYLAEEKNNKEPRSTAIEAIQKRIDELIEDK